MERKCQKMSDEKIVQHISARIIKAQEPTAMDPQDKKMGGILSYALRPSYDPTVLLKYVRESTILPQCISAYKRNIAGYGIGVRYRNEVPETPEMLAEYNMLDDLLETLSLSKPLKEVWEQIIEQREGQAYSFMEVVEDADGKVLELSNVEDISTIEILPKGEDSVEYVITRNGKEFKRNKRFRRYRQRVSGSTVYFKEYGDTRDMDMTTGEYVDVVLDEKAANSLIHFKGGYDVYGTPRWEGCLLTVDGARMAEKLNWNYFKRGRHTPMMIIVKGGSLSEESWTKLQTYMNDIEGENGQHGFLVLETESLQPDTALEGKEPVTVEVKGLADILQKDELFQEYLKNHRQKVQSSFNLPDIYVGYSQDFNVATAREAVKKTEEQVFQPERDGLAWLFNNMILSSYAFKHVEVYFKTPNIENTDNQFKLMSIARDKMSVNQTLEEYYGAMGKEFEPIEEDWAKVPQYVFAQMQTAIDNANTDAATKDEIVPVLKAVRKALLNVNNDKTYP